MATEPDFDSSPARPWQPAEAEPLADRSDPDDEIGRPDPRAGIVWPADEPPRVDQRIAAEPEPRAPFEERWAAQAIAPPEGWTDPPTSADGPRLWDRVLLAEASRAARYERPVTVAFAEIHGLEHVTVEHGADAAYRVLTACARHIGAEIRASDHLARLDRTRFGILLPETTEIEAINVLERIRTACERELAAVRGELTVAIGWASRATDGELTDAVGVAQARLAADHGDDRGA
jgi:diguanylate cyclase (GGDEF)-like protein